MLRSIYIPRGLGEDMGYPELTKRGDADLRFGRLVVLAGPNGAGKSRYLQLLARLTLEYERSREGRWEIASERRRQISLHELTLPPGPQKEMTLKDLRSSLAQAEISAERWDRFRIEIDGGPLAFVDLSSRHRPPIVHNRDLPPAESAQRILITRLPGFRTAASGMDAYIVAIGQALWNRGHPRASQVRLIRDQGEDADIFNVLLKDLVGGEITVENVDEYGRAIPLFRGVPFDPTHISDGEAVLITWAIALHRQQDGMRDAIIQIDEPENHLHPDACVKALATLRDKVLGPSGQIWIATHAVQVLAFAGLESVWFVDNGRIEYGGNKVDIVINRLLGGLEGRARLRAFLSDADDLGFHKFAAECLVPPAVATHREGDPQEGVFANAIRRRSTEAKPLRVLDYGAGRGRLAKALSEARKSIENDQLGSIDYRAYNGPLSSPDERAECERNVAELNGAFHASAVHINDLRGLALPAAEKIDLVVLCNVLHEIPPIRWERLFEEVASILSVEGMMLLMEDQEMSMGELPTKEGFVVLDEIEVMALFGVATGQGVKDVSAAPGGRLSVIEVQHSVLCRYSRDNLNTALEMVMRRAKSRIESLRAGTASFQGGRQHAYYSILYVNAMLASG